MKNFALLVFSGILLSCQAVTDQPQQRSVLWLRQTEERRLEQQMIVPRLRPNVPDEKDTFSLSCNLIRPSCILLASLACSHIGVFLVGAYIFHGSHDDNQSSFNDEYFLEN